MDFQILSEISNIEVVARGRGIRNLARLCRVYGKANWRKIKALPASGSPLAVCGWRSYTGYEAHGKGRKETKRKRYLD
jgi:intracellular sulfur oxidation DsrE/DsrF family protein